MKSIIALSAILGLTVAFPAPHPWTVTKRPLAEKDVIYDRQTGCPATLTAGEFEFPHYITQISAANPDTSYGDQYDGVFTPNDISSIFSFDIPASRADANCTLEFLFPLQSQLQTSSFNYSGGGTFFFTGYNPGSCPGPQTTYNNQPAPGPFPPFPPLHMEPGNAYTIDIGPCFVSAGTCVAGLTSTNDTYFSFFQDDGTCPIGIYTAYSYGLPTPAGE